MFPSLRKHDYAISLRTWRTRARVEYTCTWKDENRYESVEMVLDENIRKGLIRWDRIETRVYFSISGLKNFVIFDSKSR